jgi:hypothetical protein
VMSPKGVLCMLWECHLDKSVTTEKGRLWDINGSHRRDLDLDLISRSAVMTCDLRESGVHDLSWNLGGVETRSVGILVATQQLG